MVELASLSVASEGITLAPQTQARILKQMSQFLDWCVGEGELGANPWEALKVKDRPEVHPHGMLTDEQVSILLGAKDRVLHSALLFGLLTGMRSGEICGLMAEDITAKGNLGRFVSIRPNAVRLLKSKAAEREVPLHGVLEQLLDTALPTSGRLFPHLTVDKVVKRYAKLRHRHPELQRHRVPLHPQVVHHPVRAHRGSGALHCQSCWAPISEIAKQADLWVVLSRDI